MEHVVTGFPAHVSSRGSWLRRLVSALIARDQRFREERALAMLDDHLRRDLGLEPKMGVSASRWDAPLPMTMR